MVMLATDNLTARERDLYEQEKTLAQMQIDYNVRIKELDLELAKQEAMWGSLLRIPITIVKLPVLVLFGVAYIVSIARKHEPSDKFWTFLR